MNGLWLIGLLGVLVWFWLDSARARELATELARAMCQKRGLQFLDDTVHQTRLGLRWTSQGLRLRRMFSFDFSMEGVGRRSAWLILLGTQVEQFDLGLPKASDSIPPVEAGSANPASDQSAEDNKVVPFKRPKQ
jgi:hypothetical protein